MKYGNIQWILHGWDDKKKKSIFGTRKRKKSGELLKRKTYIMLEMCIDFKKKGKEVEDG